ncbi:ATP-binding protein [Cryobacterium tagatosivorans]|uniref:AAA+ ATPase domain-containing protein n=1 Tax=Cryobacterium tagatosivorans TaxID=1259199 RepID=A0A4R8UAM9_9MICO|nr:ATP-binding protein [Cryobacterium tagatosivorans]TFB47267.1 hypothetical protein E3O23_15535 [Cryobacterium tagatosivorans]
MKLFSDDDILQLDTVDGLLEYLRHPAVRPTMPTMEAYVAMSEEERMGIDDLRLDYLGSDVVISTPQVLAIEEMVLFALRYNRKRHVGRVGTMISGRPTMGKTTAAIGAMRAVFDKYEKEVPDWEKRNHIPVVCIDVPAGTTPKALMSRFARFLGLPVGTRDSKEDIEYLVVRHLNAARTRLVVVDELQNLSGKNLASVGSASMLKDLTNSVHATFLYTGFNIHEGDMMSGICGQQIAGRASHAVLQPYTVGNPEERKAWRSIVASFENELLLYSHKPGDLAIPEADYLFDRTQGNINSLARLLMGGAQDILFESPGPRAEKLTIERLDRIELDITATQQSEGLKEIERAKKKQPNAKKVPRAA